MDYTDKFKSSYYRRDRNHDYYSRCIYMITMLKSPDIPDFSFLIGTLDDPDFPPNVSVTEVGKAIRYEIRRLQRLHPKIYIPRYIVMPDHIHMIVFVKERIDVHLGVIIQEFKSNCRLRYWQKDDSPSLFTEGYNDRILRRKGQLENMNRYIMDNPRRLMVKRKYGHLFQGGLMLKIGFDGKERAYGIFGNIYLLDDPEKMVVRYRRAYDDQPELWKALEKEYDDVLRNGGVLVSPFIHPKESEWLKKGCEESGKIIRIIDNGFGERYKPPGKYFDMCMEGRLLLVAPLEFDVRKKLVTRAECMDMNRLAEILAAPGLKWKCCKKPK